jgi:hypothetical protein
LVQNLGHGVETLVQLLGSESESTRVRATTALIDRALDVWHADELIDRLAALEARADKLGER